MLSLARCATISNGGRKKCTINTLDHRRNPKALQLLLKHSLLLGLGGALVGYNFGISATASPTATSSGTALWPTKPKAVAPKKASKKRSARPRRHLSRKRSGRKGRVLRRGGTRTTPPLRVTAVKTAPSPSDTSFGKTESLTITVAKPAPKAPAGQKAHPLPAEHQNLFSAPAVTITPSGSFAKPNPAEGAAAAPAPSASQQPSPAAPSPSLGFDHNEALTIRTTPLQAPSPQHAPQPISKAAQTTPSRPSTAETRPAPQNTKPPQQATKPSEESSTLARFLNQKSSPTSLPGLGESVVVPQGSPLLTMARSSSSQKAAWKTAEDIEVDQETPSEGAHNVLTLHKKVQQEPLGKPVVMTLAHPKAVQLRPTPIASSQGNASPQHTSSQQEKKQLPPQSSDRNKNKLQPNSPEEVSSTEKQSGQSAAEAPNLVLKGPAAASSGAVPVLVKSATEKIAEAKGGTAEKKSSEKPQNLPETEAEQAIYKTLAYEQLPATVIASEEGPKITFGGDLCSFIGSVNQEDARGAKDGSPHFAFGWADLVMEISGAATEDFHYKYSADLQIMPNDLCMNDNYAELSTPFGTLQFGNLKGVESALLEDATSLNGGTGGVDGSVWDLFNRSAGLPNAVHLAGFTKRATKLTLYSPRFYGFKVGLSYTPNPGHSGWDSPDSTDYANANDNDDDVFHNDDMRKRNNLAYGINFEQSLKDLTLSAALVAVTETTTMNIDVNKTASAEDESEPTKAVYQMSREIALKKDTAIQASASLKYKNFQIAGGFIDNGELNLPKTKYEADRLAKYGFHLGNAGKGWNAGVKVSYGCLDVSLTHHNMSRRVTNYNDTKGTVNTFAVDCQLLSGVKIFTEVNRIETSTDKDVAALYDNDRPARNKGTTIFVGSKVSF